MPFLQAICSMLGVHMSSLFHQLIKFTTTQKITNYREDYSYALFTDRTNEKLQSIGQVAAHT